MFILKSLKKFVFYSTVVDLDPYPDPDSMTLWIRICIRIELNCWIRILIRIESIWIHNSGKKFKVKTTSIIMVKNVLKCIFSSFFYPLDPDLDFESKIRTPNPQNH
jgi:hypothetical protein